MGGITFDTPLAAVPGIGPRFAAKLAKLGVATAGGLLRHFPARYEDFSRITKIADLAPREECTVEGTVRRITVRRAWRKRMFVIEAWIEDDTGEVRAVWFNQTYIQNVLHEGARANLSGKVSVSREGELYLSNPNYEVVRSAAQETRHTGRIVPIYPETKGLTSKGLRYLIQPLLERTRIPAECIPSSVLARERLPGLADALHAVHFPDTLDAALRAKRRFAFEDLLLLELVMLRERARIAAEKAPSLRIGVPLIKEHVDAIPFPLTPSQKKALWEIVQDMNRAHPMNRLLQGDVGSGKTIVAAIAAILAARRGYQTAFMAPTEILARQHYKTITGFFPEHEGGVALLTASESRVFYGKGLETTLSKTDLRRALAASKIMVAIGTHALLQRDVVLPSLALVVVDEQHRFGVRQRAALGAGTRGSAPHFLSMSATPIPRTLSLTLFGDLDLSLITELPKDRKAIVTRVVPPEERKDAYRFIRTEIQKGRQAFVVCPRIQPADGNGRLTTKETEALNIRTATEEFEKLSKKVFPDLAVALLHGRMKAAEKEQTMRAFRENETNILVATSVIEVGVDVPNATIMMIEGAERFGLAQLYQFRGRVGRGAHQSYCFLFSDSSSATAGKRLAAIATAKNGFELAEKDLKLRGPGEFLGSEQTGMPDIAMKALQNPDLVVRAKACAEEVLEGDPSLARHEALRERLLEFAAYIHRE